MMALRDKDVPQTISTSYSDDEQTGKNKLSILSLYVTIGPQLRIIASFSRYLVPRN